MKFKTSLIFSLAALVLAGGCGSSDSDTNVKRAPKFDDPVADAKHIDGPMAEQARQAAETFAKNPDNVAACHELGLTWLSASASMIDGKAGASDKEQKQRADLSVQVLRKCAKLDKNNRATQQSLAMALMNAHEYEEGAAVYKAIAEANPKDAQAWQNYAMALDQAGDMKAADAAYEKFFALSDKNDPRIQQMKRARDAMKNSIPLMS